MVDLNGQVLIVDGYNIIGAWEELKILREKYLGGARDQLIAILAAYVDCCWERIIVVFDGQDFAWETVDGVEVVFTARGESADTMIERLAAGLASRYRIEVATSDLAERRAASAFGAVIFSAQAFKEHLEAQREIILRFDCSPDKQRLVLNDFLKQSVQETLEKLRRS